MPLFENKIKRTMFFFKCKPLLVYKMNKLNLFNALPVLLCFTGEEVQNNGYIAMGT